MVDDEPDLEALVLQKFRRQIRDGAVSFVFAHDGMEALQSIDGIRDIDMVVCDINMPRMDGLSLLEKLQEAEDQLSTIIVSAYGDMGNIRTAMNRGAFDFHHQADRFRRSGDDDRQDAEAPRGAARGATPAGGGGARACLAVALFLAQPRRAPCRRRRQPSMAGSGARWRRIFTDIASFTSLVETLSRQCWAHCSTNISAA